MSNNDKQTCEFDSNKCNEKISKVKDKVSIPKTNIEIISYGMLLCKFHYNKFIHNENYRLEKMLLVCSHPKHDEYRSQSNYNANKKLKKLILEKVSKRLIAILQLDENSKICSLYRKKTDNDPDYIILKEYNAPVSKKDNNDKILKIGTHTYELRNDHQESVNNYCLQNIEKMFFLNIDDYHNIHHKNQLILLQTHNIFDFIIILLNSNPDIFKISAYSSDISVHTGRNVKNQASISHQSGTNQVADCDQKKMKYSSLESSQQAESNGIDSVLIIKNFNEIFMSKLNSCYYEQNEIWKQFLIEDSYENRMESLNVHNYEGHIQHHQELRFMINSKLIDFILHPLHSTKDYIECTNLLFKVFERLKNNGSESGIPLEILSLIPIIDPLYISLNSQETLFQTYHFFFEMLYHKLFGEKKILSQKPKQTIISLILNRTPDISKTDWKKIHNVAIKRFEHSKDAEYRMMIDLLDNFIPLTLDIYTVLFRSGFFEGYLESMIRIWILFQRLRRHNYNKAPLIFLNDVFYWTSNNHPIINILKNHLPIFNDYFVENFHSSIRNQTAESNSIQQIIQKAKIIDVERTNNFSFKEAFVNSRNPIISYVKLDYLEKKTSLFLLDLFNNIFHNIGNTQQINGKKFPNFSLPTFNINVDVKVLPLAWNTETKPSDDKFCDAKKCLLSNNNNNPLFNNSIVLTCGHAYHKQCYLLKIEDENNSDLNEDIDNDEDIKNILERIESNIK
ncbi:hypothetical protein C1646_768817 [Rhizophagus diaphanus]|nr:hypothetical protein C1646_768817 [Rhizophagus diaphanus] [Rhizophagus sp. MUCL 43196]